MIRDTKFSYGSISILFHWLGALALAYLWFTGPDDHGGSASVATANHIAMGAGLGLFLLARIAWRMASVSPAPLSSNGMLNTVATVVKMLLLIDILLILATGVLGVWFGGQAINAFGSIPLPTLVPPAPHFVGPMRGLHSLSANLILPALIGLHVLGALKHLVIDRDGTFSRMIWPARQA
jgi:cytochrome b561